MWTFNGGENIAIICSLISIVIILTIIVLFFISRNIKNIDFEENTMFQIIENNSIRKILNFFKKSAFVIFNIYVSIYGSYNFFNKKSSKYLKDLGSIEVKKEHIVYYYINEIEIILFTLFLGSLISLILSSSYLIKGAIGIDTLSRNDYKDGVKTDSVYYILDGEKNEVDLNIYPIEYSADEFNNIIKKNENKFIEGILGSNKSIKEINSNLNFTSYFLSYPFNVTYYPSDTEIISSKGKIKDALEEDMEVLLKYKISYNGNEIDKEINLTVKKNITITEAIINEFNKEEEISRDSDKVDLPKSINGETLKWEEVRDNKGFIVLIFTLIIIALLIYFQNKIIERKLKEKNREIREIYPSILYKYALLSLSGMNSRHVWKRMIDDEKNNKNSLIKEMIYTYRDMENGTPEIEAYKKMENRVNLKEIKNFLSIIRRGIEVGGRGMVDLLKEEIRNSRDMEMSLALIKGEKAGTKLLLPEGVLFLVVMIIIIIPSFLGMGI